MRALIASPLGLLVGLSLGALGGGGSILAVPALVHGVGESAQAATGTSLVVVGAAALIGVVPHWRKGHVQFRSGMLFALAGIGGSFIGTRLNRGVDGDVLLLLFSIFMVLAGVAMLRNRPRDVGEAPPAEGDGAFIVVPDGAVCSPVEPLGVAAGSFAAGGSSAGGAATGTAVEAVVERGGLATLVWPGPCELRPRPSRCRTIKVLLAGTVVGALTGFFGVGGGFIIVPALVLTLGLSMPAAVGTSLVVIAINSAIALGMRAGSAEIDWAATVPFLAMAAIGTVLGGRISERIDPARLKLAFVGLLAAVALLTGVSAAAALIA